MLPYIFGLLSACSFGISNTYWKTANKSIGFSGLVFFRGIIASFSLGITWWLLTLISHKQNALITNTATLTQLGLTILLCIVCSFGLVFYLKSLNNTPVSISVPLSSINIFGILTAVLILGEPFKWIYYISFGLGGIGVLLCNDYQLKGQNIKWNTGAMYAVIAAFFWGVTYTLFKFPAIWLGAIPLAFILECCVLCTAFIWTIVKEPFFFRSSEILSFSNLKHYSILAILLLGGTLFFNLAVQKIPLLIINIFGNFTLVVSILTGILFYKERISFKQIIGIVFLLSSIFVVQYF